MEGPQFLLPEIRRKATFSKQELSSRPWGNGGPYPNAWPWEKDFWGPDSPLQSKSNFHSSRGTIQHSAELFPNCVPLCLLCGPVPLLHSPREGPDVLLFPAIRYHSDCSILINWTLVPNGLGLWIWTVHFSSLGSSVPVSKSLTSSSWCNQGAQWDSFVQSHHAIWW